MIDQVCCFREVVFCSPGVFTEYDDCVILPVGKVGEMFCVHAGAVAARFFEDADDAGGDGSPCDTCGKDLPAGMQHPADAFGSLGADGVVGAEEENTGHSCWCYSVFSRREAVSRSLMVCSLL